MQNRPLQKRVAKAAVQFFFLKHQIIQTMPDLERRRIRLVCEACQLATLELCRECLEGRGGYFNTTIQPPHLIARVLRREIVGAGADDLMAPYKQVTMTDRVAIAQ